MARISIMEALRKVLEASKDYTDEKSISLDKDEYLDLRTEDKTVIGAINELNDKKETINKQEINT